MQHACIAKAIPRPIGLPDLPRARRQPVALGAAPPALAQEATPPQNLIVDTIVSDWTVAAPRLFYLTYPNCPEFAGSPVTIDGKYFYYKVENRLLRRFIPGEGAQPRTINISGPVGDYVAEGEARKCIPLPLGLNCVTTDYVFYIADETTIVRYNAVDGISAGIYTASRPVSQAARLNGLVLANRGASVFFGPNLFFFDKRWTPCPVPPGCFVTPSTDVLRTIGQSGGTPTDLYLRNTTTSQKGQKLTSDGANLYWAEQDTDLPTSPSVIKRLSSDAAALPKINLTVTGLEITQGIQRENNGLPLVQLRPTFVRVFARAAGQSVPAITMQLQVSASSLGTTTLSPINRLGGVRTSRLTVLVNPSRGVTNDSFLFELPWEYTRVPDLRLRATINPFGFPQEPTLADNTFSAGPFDFKPTPRLNVIFVEFPFRLNNTDYRPTGTLANVSWINRVYPLGASIGNEGWNYGLNYRIWEVNDAGLSARVNRQSPECDAYVKRKSDGAIEKDDREFCASDYVNGLLRDLRSRRSVPDGTFLYGEIPDTGVAGQFPRGQEGGSSVSSGPDGANWNGYYAGHEIGHSLGLGHPQTADGSCGLQGSDPQPPYSNGWIGTADSTIVGFDSSNTTVLAGASYFDLMAYCQPQWISDVNYERIYNRLTAPAAVQSVETRQAGDWLSVYGSLDAAGERAAVSLIRRLAGTLNAPAREPGDFTLRLLDEQGTQLADYPFTPEPSDDGVGRLGFGLIVPFAAGTRAVSIVKISSGETLYSRQFSASLPTISGVALQNAADPFGGMATLSWTASDPDGDGLSFDVLYSADNGASFQPLALDVTGGNLPIDANTLYGSSVVFRVVANDGAQGAESDSPAYTLAARPPQPRILNPVDGTRLEWGQLVNLRGEASDRQDGLVAAVGLSWSNQKGVLGAGPQLSVDDLPVGTNVITLTATNSAGISASTSIKVLVSDDLGEPGPILAATPDSLSWNIEPGATQALTATLALSNAGGSTLNWTASSDVPWLTVSPITGTAPLTLIANADPQGLAANTNARATITLRAVDGAGQPFQTLTVPVAVYVGNPGYGEPPGTVIMTDLHLPLVIR